METDHAENELADFGHNRGAYGQKWMGQRINAFLERNIIIPRSETDQGEVKDDGRIITAGSGPEYASADVHNNPNWIRNRARNLLAIADYLENRDAILAAKEAEATAALNRRRDELASEFTAVNSYGGQLPYTQNLINRIIELEGATK